MRTSLYPYSSFYSRPRSTDASSPPVPEYAIGDFCIDEHRPIKVIVIGAGYGGIIAGIRFPQKISNLELAIYEKGARVGGTWFHNNYPGLACDVPAHCYQVSFEEKKDWSSFYPTGPEIRQHLQEITDKYKLMRYTKLQHEVVHAEYDAAAGKWNVRVRRPNPDTGISEEIEDSADVLLSATGGLSRWKWPDIDGLSDFKGQLLHSAGFDTEPKTWQEIADTWGDKSVGVIGVGSSAVQIVAALQPKVKKLVHYVRGKTWIAPPFAGESLAKLLGRECPEVGNFRFTPEELERFEKDPEFFRHFRHTLESELNSSHQLTLRGTPMQMQSQAKFRENMEKKLEKKPWIAECLIPDFSVACRRLTPAPGFLEALCEDNVDFVPGPIKRVTEKGVETVNGVSHDLDVIICATGYDTSYQLPFKIMGREGLDINEKWKPHPVSYMSVAVDGFPNLFFLFGPNCALATGTIIPLLEAQVTYAVQATQKIQRERLKSMEVKVKAVQDFDEHLEAYFPKTVFVEKVRTWYKVGKEEGRVVALWPGSALHHIRALAHPRWEDYNYELADSVNNTLYWLGDGQTYNEKTLSGDRAWYLRAPFLDIPPVPED